MIKQVFIFLGFLATIVVSCNKQDSLLPNITGKAGEVVVVIDDNEWNSNPGNSLQTILNQHHVALPQPEPIFDLIRIPHKAFSSIFKSHRNIIIVEKGNGFEKPAIIVKKNVWASPQLFINIVAKTSQELNDLIEKNEGLIVRYIEEAERERIIENYKKYEDLKIRKDLEKKYNLALNIPKGYKLDTDTNNFVWISHETPLISQGIFVYSYEYSDTSMFSLDSLINKRNKYLKHYVSGPAPNSYMTTERDFPISYKEFMKDSMYIAEIRGLWKLEGDFMGGPFISFSTADTKRNRIVTVECYVYAPKYDKRNYLRQVEGILYTLKIK
ncbi:MAG: hypothetical protein A2W98_11305 [Bacteroidetes bacterium GWF2_33_38]|nr:MAG: hypothetical protein A2W98_11305 [Bacteroidetes bacterium GWF2_33_38]OFY76678.1 MAG: hypothetical protein A2265_08950 [Bacteroidetes bacterium RIFOXYA12_FULL_33_9]OFY86779.1 MAG: hypothetical protein A2236_10445 [Bacteroidetes bacterium RIFOXYA2_FULL_33_7]